MKKLFSLILESIGEDPSRDGLKDTPERVNKAYKEWFASYHTDPPDLTEFKVKCKSNEMIVVNDINFYTHCEHHMAPFFGIVSVGYIPTNRVVGLSKIVRVVDYFSHKLQIQERLTQDIANYIEDSINPDGLGVRVKARHLCMESRGVHQRGTHTITSCLRGQFESDSAVKQEFLLLTNTNTVI